MAFHLLGYWVEREFARATTVVNPEMAMDVSYWDLSAISGSTRVARQAGM